MRFKSTGRAADAYGGLVSVDEDGNLFEGYDSHFIVNPRQDDPSRQHQDLGSQMDHTPDHLTPEECDELADEMIARWRAFKEKRGTGPAKVHVVTAGAYESEEIVGVTSSEEKARAMCAAYNQRHRESPNSQYAATFNPYVLDAEPK